MSKIWHIPDAYLPKPAGDDPVYKNHESVCVLNTTAQDAHLLFDFYFADREPIDNVSVVVPAQRCYHVRMDDPAQIGGVQLPFDVPYGIRIRCDVAISVQYSRMYATTHNISLMTTMAYPDP
ncbi:MAG: sensory rhodopsin transducer, partial [Anaerolineae bacterium]|nr:sensory rhodopsin transducer [Anaerolineae bacterium]